jgi:hypothetical protein
MEVTRDIDFIHKQKARDASDVNKFQKKNPSFSTTNEHESEKTFYANSANEREFIIDFASR